jgi:hypothetical protein
LKDTAELPYKFIFQSPDQAAEVSEEGTALAHSNPHEAPTDALPAGHESGAPAMDKMSNVVEFQMLESLESYQEKITKGESVKVKVLLIKDNKIVTTQLMDIPGKFETPWMGMTLSLQELKLAAAPRSFGEACSF